MVELRDGQLWINGKSELVFAGELHYFRLERRVWKERIAQAKGMGCNAIASYVPWIIHEPVEGEIDLVGRVWPENDLGAFIDLVHEAGLWFIPRPGPFVMAEMKNEGIPYWVYTKFPDAVPVSFRGEKATSATLDYLHEGFLAVAKAWYAAVMPIFASRLVTAGGPVIALQLDNEVGMLSWVTNQPDLSENALCGFAEWLGKRYKADELKARYPFDLNDVAARQAAFRHPDAGYALPFWRDFSGWTRAKIARYVAKLRGFAEDFGVVGVPFIINIHGSGGGRGLTFPIGIHHLFEAYTQTPGYWPGSDHYIGELTCDNAADLYLINAFMRAVRRPEQPLAAMEFEVGNGDYGDSGQRRYSNAAADFKVRLSLAQGNRAINYYLLAGGRNPVLKPPAGDGSERAAITGERHGFAAPISPEGALDYTYHGLAETTRICRAVADNLATMEEVLDDLAIGFLPDYYATDFTYPGPIAELVGKLEGARYPLTTMTRALLEAKLAFSAVRLDVDPAKPWPKLICVSPALHLDADVQRRLVHHVEKGGNLLVYGDFPFLDLEGRPAKVLAEACGVRRGPELKDVVRHYYPSVAKTELWPGSSEQRVWRMTTFEGLGPSTRPILQSVDGHVCGFDASVGRGKVIAIGCEYGLHPPFVRALLDLVSLKRQFPSSDDGVTGVLQSVMQNADGESFVTLINLDWTPKTVTVGAIASPYKSIAAKVDLGPRQAKLLPRGVRFSGYGLTLATTEIVRAEGSRLTFRGDGDVIFAGEADLPTLRLSGATASHDGSKSMLVSPTERGKEFSIEILPTKSV
jgi:beta-galactosidase